MNFFSEDLDLTPRELVISDDQVHHFKNVARGKAGDAVKVFKGDGTVGYGLVKECKKKALVLDIESCRILSKDDRSLNLILGVPKKEYVESIFRSSVQMGINKLYLIHTKYSPWKFKSSPRLEKILTSSMVQSENPFLPEIIELPAIDAIQEVPGRKMAFITEEKSTNLGQEMITSYIVGPEGGFHPEEIEYFKSDSDIELTHLPTAIMKAEVAVSFGAGFIQGLSAKR